MAIEDIVVELREMGKTPLFSDANMARWAATEHISELGLAKRLAAQ